MKVEFDIQGSVKNESGNLGSIICSLDNEPYSFCLPGATSAYDRASKAYSDLTGGTHTFKAAYSITDSTGTNLEDLTPATFTWEINSTNTNTIPKNEGPSREPEPYAYPINEQGNLTVITKVSANVPSSPATDGTAASQVSAVPEDFIIQVAGINPTPFESPGRESPGTLVTLGAGSFDVSVYSPPAGYGQSYSGDCSGNMKPNETKTCIVTNSFLSGNKTNPIGKLVVNNKSFPPWADYFSFEVTGTPASPAKFGIAGEGSQEIQMLGGSNYYKVVHSQASSHTPSLSAFGNYTTSYSDDCDGFFISPQETKTCTITNTVIVEGQGTLTVIQNVINDNGGTGKAADFKAKITGNPTRWIGDYGINWGGE